jgi:hypothetical protein
MTIKRLTPATAVAQLKREFPAWAEADVRRLVDKPGEGYWNFDLEIPGCSLFCQHAEISGYWLEISDETGKILSNGTGDYQPSLAEAIAALRQAAAKQMQVLGTLGDADGN